MDQQDAEAAGGAPFDAASAVAKPKGSAAVLQKVFGQDAGVKAAQSLQKASIVTLPKVPAAPPRANRCPAAALSRAGGVDADLGQDPRPDQRERAAPHRHHEAARAVLLQHRAPAEA
jgi:hypothetical protein